MCCAGFSWVRFSALQTSWSWPGQPAADAAGINANSQLEVSLSDKFLPQTPWVHQHFRFFAFRFMLNGRTGPALSVLVLMELDSSRRPSDRNRRLGVGIIFIDITFGGLFIITPIIGKQNWIEPGLLFSSVNYDLAQKEDFFCKFICGREFVCESFWS